MLDVKKSVKLIALSRGIKVGKLAERLGMKQQALSDWLYRSDIPRMDTAEKILNELGCHLAIVDDESGEILF